MNDRRYAMNVAVSEMAFWREPQHTWEKIGSVVPGVETIFTGPEGDDEGSSKQIEDLEMLISQGVSGLVVFPNDSVTVVPAINSAIEKGIPVITAFADVKNSKRLAHIGTDQTRLAERIANRVMTDFEDRLKTTSRAVVMVGRNNSQDQADRFDGIFNSVRGHLKSIESVEDKFKADEAERVVLELLGRYDDINFIFGCNSQSAIGAVEALKKAGRKPGDVVVTGWDTERDVLKHIRTLPGVSSWVHATAVLYSSYMVQVCFGILEAEYFGYLYPDTLYTRELSRPAVPELIRIPMKDVVTSENVDEYLGNL